MPRTRYAGGVPIAAKQLCRIATGTYTGDGTIYQLITGIGFTPKFLGIYWRGAAPSDDYYRFWKSDTMPNDYCHLLYVGVSLGLRTDMLTALVADGFTVDDAAADLHPNKNGQLYDFVAWG